MRNLRSLFRLSFGFLLSLSLGCNREPDTHKVSGDVKVRIPHPADGGGYRLEEVSLHGIKSLYKLSGDYVTFYIYPTVSGGKLRGFQPKTRFLKSGDVYVPEDTLSQQLAVIYAHYQNFAALDAEVGAQGINTWPRDVGVEVRYRKGKSFDENNAFYEGRTDSMLIVPYTQDYLPIPVNAGILAHEYFHSLYFKIVEKPVFSEAVQSQNKNLLESLTRFANVESQEAIKPLPGNNVVTPDDYHQVLSRGLNEGLADFWAWVYTGDPEFLQNSLPSEKLARDLNISERDAREFIFPTSEVWQMEVENCSRTFRTCANTRLPYRLGTKYARLLKFYSGLIEKSRGVSSLEARKIVGAGVIKSLPLFREELLKLKTKTDEYFEPVHFFTLLQQAMPDLKEEEKQFLQELVKKSDNKSLIVRASKEVSR